MQVPPLLSERSPLIALPAGTSLFQDLDGCLCDFSGAYQATFGHHQDSLPEDEMWGHIGKHHDFFGTLPAFPGAIAYFNAIRHLRPIILTACHLLHYEQTCEQKRRWVALHLGAEVPVITTVGGLSKPQHMRRSGDILVDDYGKNCLAWEAAGGTAIKHRSFEGTLSALRDFSSIAGLPESTSFA